MTEEKSNLWISWALPAIVVVVALLQLVLVYNSSLSRWKGGGFGMYADPHPNSFRTFWLKGNRNGEEKAFRIYPIDNHVDWDKLDGTLAKSLIQSMRSKAKVARYYPATINLGRIQDLLDELRQLNIEELDELDSFPLDDVELITHELWLTDDLSAIEAREIYKVPLK